MYFSRGITLCTVAALTAIMVVGATDSAPARSKLHHSSSLGKKQAVAIAVSMPAPIPSPTTQAPASLPRFFKISDVLAKRDRGEPLSVIATSDEKTTKVAALASGPIDDSGPPRILPETSDEPFGLFTFRAPEGQLWVKWRGVEASLRAETEALERCRADSESCSLAAVRFLTVVDAASGRKDRARLDAVNRGINANIKYVSDLAQHGVPDLWSTPLASFTSGRGDCEDYAIAKYVALRAAGMADADMQILLVRDRLARQDHAVLAVRQDGRWLMLDNRHDVLMERAETRQFEPLFAIDRQGVKLFAAPYAARPAQEYEASPAMSDAPLSSAMSELPLLL